MGGDHQRLAESKLQLPLGQLTEGGQLEEPWVSLNHLFQALHLGAPPLSRVDFELMAVYKMFLYLANL